MNGQGLRRRLSWLLAAGSLLTASSGAAAGTAVAAAPAAAASSGTFKVCGCVIYITADPGTNTLWMVNLRAKSITVVSERTKKVLARINLGSLIGTNYVGELAVDPVRGIVWEFAGTHLVGMSDKTLKVVRNLRGKAFAHSGVVDPTAGELLMTTESGIVGVSETTGKLLTTASFGVPGNLAIGINGTVADPKTGTLFVSLDLYGTRTWLEAIDEATGKATIFRRFTGFTLGLVVDPAASTVWDRTDGSFSEFSATGRHKLIATIPVDAAFGPIIEDPTTRLIWIGPSPTNKLTQFSEGSGSVIKTLTVPARSSDITLDTRSHTVFVHLATSVWFYRYKA